ncbi:MAG TPA: tartrate-resistant acid phosphatase type 5 family protein, partial [Bacteroidota bacterium]|nr:tartrate-resistant acid phosphatase type 5 family protein [Bacteroidota bacterium]
MPAFHVPERNAGTRYLQFIAVGDFGTGGDEQREVGESMAAKAKSDSISFVLALGDNFYETGVRSVTDPAWQNGFEKMYDERSLQVPFYAVLGNHDYVDNPQAQVDYTNLSTRWRMPDRYYTFVSPIDDTTAVQFFCLDTNPLTDLSLKEARTLSDTSLAGRQIAWLDRELARSTARWKIVLGHHTVYSNGEHGSNEELRTLLEPLFIKYRVDVYLCGHDHHQELLTPVQGVYYIISGAGAKHRDVTWRDNTV